MTYRPPVGFIGLGTMGWPMAERLYRSGYPLMVYNRTKGKQDDFVQKHPGVIGVGKPRELADLCDTVITMLPDGPDVEEVLFAEPYGVCAVPQAVVRLSLVIDMSSTAPRAAQQFARRLRFRAVSFLDAPVSGGPQAAADGKLSIMVGGRQDIFEFARPILEALGRPVPMGEVGSGQIMKCLNQLVVAVILEDTAKEIILARKSGLDPAAACGVLDRGLAKTQIRERKAPLMLVHDFLPPQFKASLHLKDLRNVEAYMREHRDRFSRADIKEAARLRKMFEKLVAKGHGEEDHAAIFRIVEEEAQK